MNERASGTPAAGPRNRVRLSGNGRMQIEPAIGNQIRANPAPIRIVVIFVNYGPYHLARASALLRHPQVDPYFIELAATQKLYPWLGDKQKLGDRLITLEDKPYETCSGREIARKAVSVLVDLRPAVVVIAGYSEAPMRAAARWARRNGRGVVVLSESTSWDHPRRWWLEHIKRLWILRYVDAAVVGGEPHRRYIVELGVDQARVWDRYNVVNNEFFTQRCDALRKEGIKRRIEAGLPQNYFLYVGRFAPQKNLPFLLRAYRRYREIHSDPWGLVMVGDGPLREQLFQIGRDEHLDDIIWTGFEQVEGLPLYYAYAGCFIMASTMEPWGLVVNEAMASGLPVIVSRRCGCAADLVAHGENGFTFDSHNEGELAGLMWEMATIPAKQRVAMGEASRKIISRWTPEAWAEQLICALRSAIERNSLSSDKRPERRPDFEKPLVTKAR